jgi:DNA-binding XRE family transcriptional regulator
MALSTKLKEYREAKGLKQADLAELVGVRRETIVNLEIPPSSWQWTLQKCSIPR